MQAHILHIVHIRLLRLICVSPLWVRFLPTDIIRVAVGVAQIGQCLLLRALRTERINNQLSPLAEERTSAGQELTFGCHALLGSHQGLASSERPGDGLQFKGERRTYVLEVLREALVLREHFLD